MIFIHIANNGLKINGGPVRAFWRNSGPENQSSSLNTFVMIHPHTPSAVVF
jgi:hypothetical protein